MRTHTALLVAAGFFGARSAGATTWQVGGGQTYTTPCAAIQAASAGDEVDIAAGTYTDTCEINPNGIHLKGVGGQPVIDLTNGSIADAKGIYVINGNDITIENLELTGAAISVANGSNGAGLRIQGSGAVVTNCYIHDNQEGILATAQSSGATLTIEFTELSHNGLGDACTTNDCVHNVYLGTGAGGDFAKLLFQFNWDHDLANETSMANGHLLKSRAQENDILYNRITGEDGYDSYEVDLPNGGLGILVGNVIEKGTDANNEYLLQYGEEGYTADGRTNQLYLSSNTFVNDYTEGTFVNVASGGTLSVAHDNVFAGPGTVSSTGTLSVDNVVGTEASFLFANASGYDYHLMSGSPAIGKAVPAGSAGSFSLAPAFEYFQPTASVVRTADSDVGAFEYGTNTTNPSSDAGDSPGDAAIGGSTEAGGDAAGLGGAGASDDGGPGGVGSGGDDGGSPTATAGPVGADGGANGAQPSGASSGCGCVSAGAGAAGPGSWLAIMGLLALWGRRGLRVRHPGRRLPARTP
jgi:MYXO-CTERM domain-containing protein